MGKKMKIIPFLCHQPRTPSFRSGGKMLHETINSAYFGATININNGAVTNKADELFFTNSPESDKSGCDSIEKVIRGARSERLFFEPRETSSILKEAKEAAAGAGAGAGAGAAAAGGLPFKESLVLSMESHDPCMDFKKSMEEMVKAYGLKDWKDLEGLLFSYLKVNGKSNHGYIIGAFVDLLVGIACTASASSCSSSHPPPPPNSSQCYCSSCSRSPSSPLSFCTSSASSSSSSSSSSDEGSSTTPCVSSLAEEEEAAEEEEIIDIIISPCYSSSEAVDDENGIKET